MKHIICIALLLTSIISGGAMAANCTRSGNTTYCDDGTTYTQSGNTTYGSDGTTYTSI